MPNTTIETEHILAECRFMLRMNEDNEAVTNALLEYTSGILDISEDTLLELLGE